MNKCSFCDSLESDVNKLLTGFKPDVFICDNCIEFGYDNLNTDEIKSFIKPNLNPKSIKDELDKYVIGQDETKKILSVATYNHILKIENNLNIKKGNILLIGNSGCGKTYVCQILAKILNLPFTIADATSLTPEGYIGENIESIFHPLIEKYEINEIEKSIVVIDEFCKKARKSGSNPNITRDIGTEDVQAGLLKMVEGKIINVQPIGTRKHPHQQNTKIDTTNILFIFCGAFVGLSDIISQRLGKNEIGFSDKIKIDKSIRESELLKQVESDDLIQYGLIPEIVGRIPIISTLDNLRLDDLIQIMKKSKDNIIDEYKELLKVDNIEINFSDETLRKIAEMAYNKNVGARGIKSIIEKLMIDFMFNVDRNKPGRYDIEI